MRGGGVVWGVGVHKEITFKIKQVLERRTKKN